MKNSKAKILEYPEETHKHMGRKTNSTQKSPKPETNPELLLLQTQRGSNANHHAALIMNKFRKTQKRKRTKQDGVKKMLK